MASSTRLALQFFQLCLVKANHNLSALPHNRTAQQVWFGDDELDQFITRRQLGGEVALLVDGVARIQKRRDFVVTKDGFDFFSRQRLFGVIAFDQIVLVEVLAQETPRVATGGSGAFLPEVDFHKSLIEAGGKFRKPAMRTPSAVLTSASKCIGSNSSGLA